MPQYKTIADLLVEGLAEIRFIENQLRKIFPQMLMAATDDHLKAALEAHHRQVGDFLEAFDRATDILKLPAAPEPGCVVGFTVNGNLQTLADCTPPTKDAALIGIALKAENYLNAVYLNTCIYARMLDYNEISKLLNSRLKPNFSMANPSADVVTMFMRETGEGEDRVVSIANERQAEWRL